MGFPKNGTAPTREPPRGPGCSPCEECHYRQNESGFNAVSDTAGNIGEIEPDFDATEVRAFGADGRGDSGAKMPGRPPGWSQTER